MGYFRELPNLLYPTVSANKNSSFDYTEVKNLFRRIKLRDDLHSVFTLFNKYEIPQGSRPDLVAEDLYGSEELDWVVCMTAGIINVRQDWPLDDKDLYNFAYNKYGTKLNQTRFYETTEVKDSNKRIILPKGKVVNSNFTIPKPDRGSPTETLNPVVGISNYEYEVRLNDKKRNIYVLKPEYLQTYLNDMRQLLIYSESSEYIHDGLIAAANVELLLP